MFARLERLLGVFAVGDVANDGLELGVGAFSGKKPAHSILEPNDLASRQRHLVIEGDDRLFGGEIFKISERNIDVIGEGAKKSA